MVLEALKAAGMYGDAAAFFFSGHGDFTGDCSLVEEAQNTFEDCLTRVPFLIKLPAWLRVGWSPAGEVSEHRDAVFCEGGRRVVCYPRIRWQLQEGPERTKAVMCRGGFT